MTWQCNTLTLHDVIMPAVGELAVVSVLIQTTQEDLVWVAVLQVDQFSQAREELCVAVGAVLVGQYRHLVICLRINNHKSYRLPTSQSQTANWKEKDDSTWPAPTNTTPILWVSYGGIWSKTLTARSISCERQFLGEFHKEIYHISAHNHYTLEKNYFYGNCFILLLFSW